MAVTDGPCTPTGGGLVAPLEPPSWETTIEACQGSAWGVCGDKRQTCQPVRPEGFSRCVFSTELTDCATASPYTQPYVAYWSITDTRGCAPCTCGPVTESACSAKVSVFHDAGCSNLLGTYSVDAAGSKCFDLPPGAGLGSKSATSPVYTPGQCQPAGGDPIGGIEPFGQMSFCCLP
ncbi:MAG: hypothetical protein U0359_18135 [Byssovorax sp.]